jgi:exopolysaccharide production protein ExoQ
MLLCIVLGRSASTLGVAILMLFVGALMFLRPYPVLRTSLVLLASWTVLSVLSVLIIAPEALLDALGRDATLTGRIPLWGMVIQEIASRPFLGHGYAGFWIEDSIPVQYIWKSIGWAAPDAHSGYLDVALQLGLMGVFCYLWLWSRLLRRTFAALRLGLPAARWVILFAAIVLLIDLDEGPLPLPDEFTMMMPIALAAMSSHARQRAARIAHPRPASRISFVGRAPVGTGALQGQST